MKAKIRYRIRIFFFFKQKTAYDIRISDWSSDVCSSDLRHRRAGGDAVQAADGGGPPHRAAHARHRPPPGDAQVRAREPAERARRRGSGPRADRKSVV